MNASYGYKMMMMMPFQSGCLILLEQLCEFYSPSHHQIRLYDIKLQQRTYKQTEFFTLNVIKMCECVLIL